MFSTVLSYVGLGGSQRVNIAKVPVVNVETLKDKRGRRLKHLVKLNHTNHSILYNHLRFHNHSPHLLGSAYLFNGSADHLTAIYEDIAARDNLEPWEDSPGEIALHDHRDFLGKKEYQRAWVDFFEDQLIEHDYSWSAVVNKFVFENGAKDSTNSHPMIHCLTAGLGHPLIHLGYAYELNSREIAMEALGLAATCYDPKLASLLTAALPSPPKHTTSDILAVFQAIHDDKRLPTFSHPGENLSTILDSPETLNIILEHFHSYKLEPDPTTSFSQSQHLASLLLISTAPNLGGHGYDFFLVHLLTTSHAIRILIPYMPPQHNSTLVREWLLITMLIYVAQCRPNLQIKQQMETFDRKDRGWDFVAKQAIESKHGYDAHFVKGCRAMKVAAETWGDKDEWFLKCAVKFASEFEEWGGFSPADMEGEGEHGGGH